MVSIDIVVYFLLGNKNIYMLYSFGNNEYANDWRIQDTKTIEEEDEDRSFLSPKEPKGFFVSILERKIQIRTSTIYYLTESVDEDVDVERYILL